MNERNLSGPEMTVYNVIRNAADENRPASQDEIFRVLKGRDPQSKKELENAVGPVLHRLRKKLPEGEIVTLPGIGYFSESATSNKS